MQLRWIRPLLALALLALPGWSRPIAAQTDRRWLADADLLIMRGRTQTRDLVRDIELLDRNSGWAVSGAPGISRLLRFDGRFWRPARMLAEGVHATTIAMHGAFDGWIAGSREQRQVYLAHFDGATIQPVTEFVRSDGTRGALDGALDDLAIAANGTAWAVGQAPGNDPAAPTWPRPLLLFFDGNAWHDRTPTQWQHGYLSRLSMVSASEGWAIGLLGKPGGQNDAAVRPVVLHLADGRWSEEPLPALWSGVQPFSMREIVMSADGQGWAIFYDYGTACPSTRLLHRSGGAWQIVPLESYGFRIITTLGLIPGTQRGWASTTNCTSRSRTTPAERLRFDNGSMTPDRTGAQLVPSVYAILDEQTQWAAAGGAMMRFSAEPLPTDRSAQAQPGERYFAVTGHSIGGAFRHYYETHGLDLGERGISERESLALFGYPLSRPFEELNPETGEPLTVQYFERARLEWHPENPELYRVLLGRLATGALLRSSRDIEPQLPAREADQPAGPGCERYRETGYELCPPLLGFWHANGSVPVLGFPITAARNEISRTDGRSYLTQWLERERLELHPELRGTPYELLLGLLGTEELRARGYLP